VAQNKENGFAVPMKTARAVGSKGKNNTLKPVTGFKVNDRQPQIPKGLGKTMFSSLIRI
jgi:hypothetical protein